MKQILCRPQVCCCCFCCSIRILSIYLFYAAFCVCVCVCSCRLCLCFSLPSASTSLLLLLKTKYFSSRARSGFRSAFRAFCASPPGCVCVFVLLCCARFSSSSSSTNLRRATRAENVGQNTVRARLATVFFTSAQQQQHTNILLSLQLFSLLCYSVN